jgi:hypothetical protein
VRAESIERVIAHNSVAVRMNTDAFRLGRRAVDDPTCLSSAGDRQQVGAAAAAGQTRLSAAVARYLFKLMAYKDEYEVARLPLTSSNDQALDAAFGPVAHVHYLLHPPLLRAIG